MKRVLSVLFSLMLVAAFVFAPVSSFACGDKSAQAAPTAGNHMMGAKGQCTPGEASACAAKMGLPIEECQKLCATGEYTMVSMSVKGMTGTDSESKISTGLSQLPGVVKVGKVSYQEGTAYVMIDPKKVKNEELVKVVGDSGYQAEIIPAMSVMQMGPQLTGDAAHPCGVAAARACAKKCAQPCGTPKAKTEKPEKTEGGK